MATLLSKCFYFLLCATYKDFPDVWITATMVHEGWKDFNTTYIKERDTSKTYAYRGQLYTKPNLASQETEQEKKLRSPCSLTATQESKSTETSIISKFLFHLVT
jgi:hypothetical protein